MEEVTDQVKRIISRELKIPFERLTPETALQDLGAESLDLQEIIFALEEEFDISIPYNANLAASGGKGLSSKVGLENLQTISQISEAVKGFMVAKTST